MTAPVTRLGDITTGHDSFPPRPSVTASEDVFADGIGIVRLGDTYAVHCNPTPTCHDGVSTTTAQTVFVNGQPITTVGSSVSCGDFVAVGSQSVFSEQG